LKVLHYVARFSVASETFIYDQINALEQSGLENKVVTSKNINCEERPFNNVKVIPLRNIVSERVTQKLAFGFEWLNWFINFRQWRDTLEQYQPDIVHCHMGNAAKTWLHVKKRFKLDIPTLISLHGSDVTMEPNIKPRYKKWLMAAGQDKSIHWTVPSEFLKAKAQQTLNLPADHIFVVHNGFNPHFSHQPVTSEIERQEITKPAILSVGRFIGCKGQKYLLKAFAKLIKLKPDVSLTLLGNGPKQLECIELAQELGIENKVTFINSASHQEVANLMKQHTVYVQPSIQDEVTLQEESFGVAALEALASGLPVIVTQCGGLPEVVAGIDEQYAKVVEQKNPDAIYNGLAELLMTDKKLPVEIIDVLKVKFSMAVNAKTVAALYSAIPKT